MTTCLKNLYDQEQIISELRQFYYDHGNALCIVNEHLEEKGLSKNKTYKRSPGSSEEIRKQSENAVEHFELYSSMVHADVDGSKVQNLELDVQIYEEQIEAQ